MFEFDSNSEMMFEFEFEFFMLCNIRLLQSHMRLKKNRPYNHWLKGQGHHLLCFSTSRTAGASSVRL